MPCQTTIDHNTVRKWDQSKGGMPAVVVRTRSDEDVGPIRIMFPNVPKSHHDSLVEITWEEFFQDFEDKQLALLIEKTSLFNKLVGRDTAEKREHGDHKAPC